MPEPLSARVLGDRVAPEALFLALERECADVFWLDAGADASEGWSFIGTGRASSFPGDVRLDVGTAASDAVSYTHLTLPTTPYV